MNWVFKWHSEVWIHQLLKHMIPLFSVTAMFTSVQAHHEEREHIYMHALSL